MYRVIIVALAMAFGLLGPAAAQDRRDYPITDFKIVGEGPIKVLIIPCMSCRWRSFDQFMERNADKYTMYAITIPGFGGSNVPDLEMWTEEPLWQENARRAVRSFVVEHGIDDAIVLSHSWGAVLSALVLGEDESFARGWVILDTFVPFDVAEQNMSQPEKLKLVERWRRSAMEPLRDIDEWQAFNSVSPALPAERRLLYHGMFMATPKDVVFQYWRENGLTDTNDAFAGVEIPVLEVKSIPRGQMDIAGAKKRYLAQYETAPHSANFETIFIEKTGHHQVEERPELIDEIVWKFATGEALTDYSPAN